MKPAVVESTTLATLAYDADRQLLQIEFRDRATYRYFNVPAMFMKRYYAPHPKEVISIV